MTTTNRTSEARIITPPLYAEEWRVVPIERPASNENLLVREPPHTTLAISDPVNYPYAQVMSNVNVLPRDETATRMYTSSLNNTMMFTNSKFTKQTVDFRNDMSRVMLIKLAERYKNSCSTLFSPAAFAQPSNSDPFYARRQRY